MYTFKTNFLSLHASVYLSTFLSLSLFLFIYPFVCLSLSSTSPEKLPILCEQSQQPRIHWLPRSSGEPISRAPELGMPPPPHLCSLKEQQIKWFYNCMVSPPPFHPTTHTLSRIMNIK